VKKLVVLGAGVYQIPLIRKAREAGHWVIAVSYGATDLGMALADESWVVDTTDKERVLDLSRAARIDGILTTGTDVAVPTIGYVCDALGLPGVSYDAAVAATCKTVMQERFAEHGVPAAAFRTVREIEGALAAADQIGFPVMVKAPNTSGSRGITKVDCADGMESALAHAMSYSRSGEVLVEECLTGLEFGAQFVVLGGEVVHCLCHNDTVTPPPVSVPIGHSCPPMFAPEVVEAAARVCASSTRALGITDAACNADLILTSDGVKVFEIGARIGATGLPEIVRLSCGIDLYAVALQLALGQTPDMRLTPGPASAILIIRSPCTGRLARARVPEEVANLPEVVSVSFDYPEGTTVREFKTGPDRIGDIFVIAGEPAAAEALAAKVAAGLDIEVLDASGEHLRAAE